MPTRTPDLFFSALLAGVGFWFALRNRTQEHAMLARVMAEAAHATKH
jgi:hypothetical protein